MTDVARSDAIYCERIARRRAGTFALASYFLPAPKRRAGFAFYSFARLADDIVDRAIGGDARAGVWHLRSYRRQITEAIEGRPAGPVFRELRWAMRHFNVSPKLVYDLVDGIERDIAPSAYPTWMDLRRYCEEVASIVAEIAIQVFGSTGTPDERKEALSRATTLGVAIRLTSILRDVGIEARAGRCYIPLADLQRFGISRDEVVSGAPVAREERWRRLMRWEIARARELYRQAMPGIAFLSPDTRRCAAACSMGYSAILGALERIQYDSVAERASVGTLTRLGVLWDAWRYEAPRAIA
jgi:15-cis-phytoene synthase